MTLDFWSKQRVAGALLVLGMVITLTGIIVVAIQGKRDLNQHLRVSKRSGKTLQPSGLSGHFLAQG